MIEDGGYEKHAFKMQLNPGMTAEYLTEESRDLVPREELAAFHDDVDALRDDVARLAARIARLPAGGGA